MASFNQITIVGHLGGEPELRFVPSGQAVCNFSVATTRKRGESEITTWFKVTAWGKLAENCDTYLHKGAQVWLSGEVYLEKWTGRDGQEGQSLIVEARDVKFLKTDKDHVKERQSDNGSWKTADVDAEIDAEVESGEIPF